MTELLAYADKHSLLVGIVLYVAYKFVPVMAEKIAPEWMSARREADAAKRATSLSLTDRVINVIENNSRVIAAVTMSVGGVQRALDLNTQQISTVADLVRKGPTCPLHDCPFMNREQNV
jgi:hypothetical protein